MITQTGLIRILKRGGVAVLSETGARVFRSQDTRRSCIGVLSDHSLSHLRRQGQVTQLPGTQDRLVWTEGQVQLKCTDAQEVHRVGPPSALSAKQRPRARTVLERVLVLEDSKQGRSYLAAAVVRFLRDWERYASGQKMTMNWTFVPTGRARHCNKSMSGLDRIGAGKSLADIRSAIGKRRFTILEAVIVQGRSMTGLASLFQSTQKAFLAEVHEAVIQLAYAYDHKIAPERTKQ